MTTRAGADSAAYERRPAPDESSTIAHLVSTRSTRYRYLVAVVEELEATVTIDQLVDAMVQWERAQDDTTEKSWHDVHEELYLVDLPTLDRASCLTFDAETGTVTQPD